MTGQLDLHVCGLGGSLCTVTASPESTVAEVKSDISSVLGTDEDYVRLFIGTKELLDGQQSLATFLQEDGPHEVTLVKRTTEQLTWIARLNINGEGLKDLPESLWGDHEVVLAALRDVEALPYVMPELWTNYDFALAAARRTWTTLKFVSQEFLRDHAIVCAAVGQSWRAFKLAPVELRGDHQIALSALSQSDKAAQHLPEKLKADRTFLLEGVCAHIFLLDLSDGKVFHTNAPSNATKEAIFQVTFSMLKDLRTGSEFVIATIFQDAHQLNYASEDLRSDEEVVAAAVQREGLSLQYAAPEMREDRNIVCKALNQNGMALVHAAKELLEDPQVVMTAVRQNGLSLRYADRLMQANIKVACAAVQQNKNALKFVAAELRPNVHCFAMGA